MVVKPLQNLRPSSSGEGGGPKNGDDDKARTSLTVELKKEELEEGDGPSMKLGLGIGESAGTHVILKQGKPDSQRCLLTLAQLRELQEQALIFKYISSGLTVPPSLVLPIWTSVVASFASFNPISIYRQFPSFVGYGPKGFDYGNVMDPEPGRCRRTDGKKWRCGKLVVLGGKYCERHMHRGCHRSRKRVEVSQTTTFPGITTPPNSSSKNTNDSVLAPVTPQLMTRPSISASTSHITLHTAASNVDFKINGKTVSGQKYSGMSAATSAVTHTSHIHGTTTAIPTATYGSGKNSYININKPYIDDGTNNGGNSVGCKNIINKTSNNRSIRRSGVSTSQVLGVSPRSVLQVRGCIGSTANRILYELEPGRCRRTDGKKWRCRRAVVTNEKYCEMHLHRGAKGYRPAFSSSIPKVSSTTNPQPTEIVRNKAGCRCLNTNLSMSIPASSQLMINNDTRGMSTSSDATISDC